jgi:hypothetical protein
MNFTEDNRPALPYPILTSTRGGTPPQTPMHRPYLSPSFERLCPSPQHNFSSSTRSSFSSSRGSSSTAGDSSLNQYIYRKPLFMESGNEPYGQVSPPVTPAKNWTYPRSTVSGLDSPVAPPQAYPQQHPPNMHAPSPATPTQPSPQHISQNRLQRDSKVISKSLKTDEERIQFKRQRNTECQKRYF